MNNAFEDVFRNKRILITGHTGFKGTWLSLWLSMLGAIVSGISLKPPSKPYLFSIIRQKKRMTHHIADIRDFNILKNIIKKEKPEVVFHFAAQPIVKFSYDDPIDTYETNVMGTVNLLEALKTAGSVKTCIVATSDKCYQNDGGKDNLFSENDILGGADPYSTSKSCVELLIDSYRTSFLKDRISLSSVRSGNVYGGGDWGHYRLIPDCIKSIERNVPIILRSPSSIRPWIYILDSLSGYLNLCSLMMGNPEGYNSKWNIGPTKMNENYKTEIIVKKIIGQYGKGVYQIGSGQFYEPEILKIKTDKITENTGWRPIIDIDTGIKHTVDWYKKYYNNNDMIKLTMSEINDYMKFEINKGS